ncbi:MAG TPA: oxygenase MpaB family protein [Aggregatilineaceae bacterium]|nr:oxygenase MpaB family protein [Aggregatilineaceae bacterium]
MIDDPVIRRIWGSIDTILIIFAGSAAEFALNKAVDWLFFTNELPDAPIERFFETVRFGQAIIFGDEATAAAAVETVNRAHQQVEAQRQATIPQWSYRDTLFMLVYYGERAYEIVYGPLSNTERLDHFRGTMEIGRAMGIKGLPDRYAEYQRQRQQHLHNPLKRSAYPDRLYQRYREHIGAVRMQGLRWVQANIVPPEVAELLGLRPQLGSGMVVGMYRYVRIPHLLRLLYPVIVPYGYKSQLAHLEQRI